MLNPLNIKKGKRPTSNVSNRRLESAKTNFTFNNINQPNKNFLNQSNSTQNFSGLNYESPQKKESYYKPSWKYSYNVDKKNFKNINIRNNPEIKYILCDYKDIDKRPKPLVYSWTKPRMVKILERNASIEEEIKSNFWKYSHIFENNNFKKPGKLLGILMTQISNGYGGESYLMNMGNNNNGNFNNNLIFNQQRKFPEEYNLKNNYEPIRLKRAKSAFKY